MKNRGKSTVIEHKISDFNYSISSDIPCIKHPNSSPIGICSFCLKEKLLNLIYSNDTNTYFNRHSCSGDVGSVGRISFLLENEKQSKTEQVILLRSSSNSVEIKKNRNGFWKIKRLFRKYREKDDEKIENSENVREGVSRSRSLCSFRGGDDGNSEYRFSSAKISDVTGGLLFDYVDHPVVEPRKTENGGDFKNMRKKFANSESVCCSDSPKMLSVIQKGNTFRGSDTHLTTFLRSPSNVSSDRGICFPIKESDIGNTMDDDGDLKNMRKKYPNSDSPNMLSILQKGNMFRGSDMHPTTFLKSPSNVNSDRGNFFHVKESDFGKTKDSNSLRCLDSPNMLSHSRQILPKRASSHPTSFLKSPSNVNSDRGNFFHVKESDFGNTKDSNSLRCLDSPNMLSHSRQSLQKRASSHSTSFLKSPSNVNSDRGIFDDDDSAFIDLKLDLLSSSRTSLSEPKLQLFSESTNSMGSLRGGSCRMNEYDTRMKEGNSGKGNQVWKWISRKKTTTSNRDEINSNFIIKS